MVRLKFIVRTGVRVLRISEGKERYYKRVAGLLKGRSNVKHWKSDKDRIMRCEMERLGRFLNKKTEKRQFRVFQSKL